MKKWVLSYTCAPRITRRRMVNQKGPSKLSKICYEHVLLISVVAGIITKPWQSFLIIIAITPLLGFHRMRCYIGVGARLRFVGVTLDRSNWVVWKWSRQQLKNLTRFKLS